MPLYLAQPTSVVQTRPILALQDGARLFALTSDSAQRAHPLLLSFKTIMHELLM